MQVHNTILPRTLTATEDKLYQCYLNGIECDFLPAKGRPQSIPEDYAIVGSDVIKALSLIENPPGKVAKGLMLRGACIAGSLDLSGCVVTQPLQLRHCKFQNEVLFDRAQFKFLSLEGCTLPRGLMANHLSCSSDVLLDYIDSRQTIDLHACTIDGLLGLNGVKVSQPEGVALNLDSSKIGGSIFFRDAFESRGRVSLISAKVGGAIDLSAVDIAINSDFAFIADGITIDDNLCIYSGSTFKGGISIKGAKIAGQLIVNNTEVVSAGGISMAMDSLEAGQALQFDSVTTDSSITLIASRLAKAVSFLHCFIGLNANSSIILSGATIGRHLTIASCGIQGEINIATSKVGAGVSIVESHLDNKTLYSSGPDNFRSSLYTIVADNLDCTGDFVISNIASKKTIRLHEIAVKGRLIIEKSHIQKELDLRGARVSSYIDDADSWPESGNLLLDGFSYEKIDPSDYSTRKRWLEHMSNESFMAQPYTQLAGALLKQGYEEASTKILIERQKSRIKNGDLPLINRTWLKIMGVFTGYGYRPSRAILLLFVVWVIGSIFFLCNDTSMICVQKVSENSSDCELLFNPFLYSADTLIPVVDLRQEKYWIPSGITAYYNAVHKALGWMLTMLMAVAIGGIIKKR